MYEYSRCISRIEITAIEIKPVVLVIFNWEIQVGKRRLFTLDA